MNILKGRTPFNLNYEIPSYLSVCMCNRTDMGENVIIDSEIKALLSQCLQSAAFFKLRWINDTAWILSVSSALFIKVGFAVYTNPCLGI